MLEGVAEPEIIFCYTKKVKPFLSLSDLVSSPARGGSGSFEGETMRAKNPIPLTCSRCSSPTAKLQGKKPPLSHVEF